MFLRIPLSMEGEEHVAPSVLFVARATPQPSIEPAHRAFAEREGGVVRVSDLRNRSATDAGEHRQFTRIELPVWKFFREEKERGKGRRRGQGIFLVGVVGILKCGHFAHRAWGFGRWAKGVFG